MAKIKQHSLTGRITLPLLHRAFRNVRRNRGAAGIDRESIVAFEINLEDNLLALMRRLKEGSYKPLPLRRVPIPKGPGQTSPLGIPAVRDRVAQEVVRLLLSPLFERLFHDDSYGFRPDRNCHLAVQQVLELHRQGHTYVLDADIQGFFDNLPHSVIMAGVAAEVADGNLLDLIERFLKAGVMEEGVFALTTVGTPQGGVISPLLANIARTASTGGSTTRASASCATPTTSRSSAAPRSGPRGTRPATTAVDLPRAHPECRKTKVTHSGKALPSWALPSRRWSVTMRTKAVEKFKTKVREVTPRHHNLDSSVIKKLNAIIRGTANYFATSFSRSGRFSRLGPLDTMRLRCMKYQRKSRADNGRFRWSSSHAWVRGP